MKTQRLFFIVIGLCLLLCVGSAVIYGILMRDFVVWNSTLEEFRTSAAKERKAFEEELSYKEAAGVMKKTPKQLENLVSRGKKTVRELMGEEGI